jgi:tripeptide aminopeptidase
LLPLLRNVDELFVRIKLQYKMLKNYKNTAKERFLKYVQIDTQSDPYSDIQPSTAKQMDLSKLLVEELFEMGILDAHLDEFGYVYATIPSNSPKDVPTICFCSHVDTSPDCSGEGVIPIIHENYQGQDLVLPDDYTQIIKLSEHEDLAQQLGNDIITASGNTLLGADNKAGVAEIMDAANHLINNPNISHGTIKILFTPDEEIGRGTKAVNLKKLGADFGYTIDGETLGSLEDETFSADAVKINITGVSQHPGFAKGRMESALKIASEIVSNLPKNNLSPESTEGMEGFIHPTNISGMVEMATIEFIIRDFTVAKLHAHELVLNEIMNNVLRNYPNSKATFEVYEQYRNMKEILDKVPHVSEYVIEAIRRSGLQPNRRSIRGGTDGSRLSFMGLPCPNIFAGEHAFHGKHEWVSVQDMEKAVETIVNLCIVWEERSS